MNPDDILFQPLDLPPLTFLPELARMYTEIIPGWYWDAYRKVHMLPMMTPGGAMSKAGSLNRAKSEELKWTGLATHETSLYFERHIYTWLNPVGRIMLLKTPPRDQLGIHIDCSKSAFKTRQHKFRIVIAGRTDSLFFLNGDDGEKVHALNIKQGIPFIIDGSWPHGMINNFARHKITLCLGAPWTGEDSPAYLDLLERSCRKFRGIRKSDLTLPTDYENYFENPDDRKKKFDD